MNYHCLVAALPDIQLESHKLTLGSQDFIAELRETLSNYDSELLMLLLQAEDNKYFIKSLKKENLPPTLTGNLLEADFSEIIQILSEQDKPKDKRILAYHQKIAQAYWEEKPLITELSWEDQLLGEYYEHARGTKNEFLAAWFEFNLNLHNILAAQICRKYKWDIKSAVIGNNEVAQALRSSNARDYGLSGTLDELPQLMALADEEDLLEREQKIEILKWTWLEEHSFFHYFSVEKLLSYLLKLQIIERRIELQKEKGKEKFDNVVNSLIAVS
jgi:hypothetical protein